MIPKMIANTLEVVYQLWPILDALNIRRCGLHAFRHPVASFIVDADMRRKSRSNSFMTRMHGQPWACLLHLRAGIIEQAMTDVANSLKFGRG